MGTLLPDIKIRQRRIVFVENIIEPTQAQIGVDPGQESQRFGIVFLVCRRKPGNGFFRFAAVKKSGLTQGVKPDIFITAPRQLISGINF